jgi:segregation and condensation protein A
MNDIAPAPDFDSSPSGASGNRDLAQPQQLVLDLNGYEGPIDLLLSLARTQKLDLAKISILALADQYLDYIVKQRHLDLEVAADYLVMATILAYLKSCLLLPSPAQAHEPGAVELADMLRHQLALLEAMQEAGRRLMARPLLGREYFFRGAPEETAGPAKPRWDIRLYALLRAYGAYCRRRTVQVLEIGPSTTFYSMDKALQRFGRFLGRVTNWRELSSFLPTAPDGGEFHRSAVAATFAAALELARSGRMELRQDHAFGPIWLRSMASATIRSGAAVGLR